MNKLIELKLDVVLEFQQKYPNSHVGGSIGLMLQGIDLQRDLSKSDLDITSDEFDLTENSYDQRSDNNDFDFAVKKTTGNEYVKIDIRISPEPSFDIIDFNGKPYNVSKLRDIVFWKAKYANKGIEKHKDDIETIKTGVRPERAAVVESNGYVDHDDLPF